MTEKQVRDIVKAEIKKLAKEEAEKVVKKATKGFMTEKEVKEMIK